jgi:hypothetical protein
MNIPIPLISPRLRSRILLFCASLAGRLQVAGVCPITSSPGDGLVNASSWINTSGQTIYICNLEIWAAGEGVIRSKVVRLRNNMVPETIFTSSCWHGDIIHFADRYQIVSEDRLVLIVAVEGHLGEAEVVIWYTTRR